MAHTTKKMKLKRTMREVLDDEASAMSVEEELMNNVVKSRRPAVLRCLHAIDARRLQERRSWVVSFSILRLFRPSRATAMLRAGRQRRRAPRDAGPEEVRLIIKEVSCAQARFQEGADRYCSLEEAKGRRGRAGLLRYSAR